MGKVISKLAAGAGGEMGLGRKRLGESAWRDILVSWVTFLYLKKMKRCITRSLFPKGKCVRGPHADGFVMMFLPCDV